MLTKLLNILSVIGFLFMPNSYQDISANAVEFNLIGYDDYYYNYTPRMYDVYGEEWVDYSYFDDSSLNYTYMVYPYNLSSDTYDVYSIFVDIPLMPWLNIEDMLLPNDNIFELQLFYTDVVPFSSISNTLQWFKSIDTLGFDYYLPYNSSVYNGLTYQDYIHSYITFDNYINSESNLFIVMRISKAYYDGLLEDDGFLPSSYYHSYLSPSNGFSVVTLWHNPIIRLSNLKITSYGYDNGYNTGFQDGISSVDTSYFYNNGYTDGVNSVNVNAIYQNGYTHGYNVGVTESSGSYGITDLLYSIFDLPVIMLSNLLSFTIFGQDAWGLILSILFLGVILYLIRLFINGHKLQ